MIDYNTFKEVRQLLLDELSSAKGGQQERAHWEVVRAFENAYPEHMETHIKARRAAQCF